jgi:hypothetical protein
MRVLFVLVVAFILHPVMAADVHTVPIDIQSYFKKNTCTEVFDYYAEARVIEKPYLYGIKSIIKSKSIVNDYSFIAWCKSSVNGPERQYVLVGQLGGEVWPGGCKFPIRDFDYPGGLSISRKQVNLSSFNDFAHKSIGRKSAFGPVIRSERDGLVYEVFCHRGAWVKSNID